MTTIEAPLYRQMVIEYQKLAMTISKIPYPSRVLKIIEKVSVSDIQAYQIGWGKLLIGWYLAGIERKKIIMPGEGFTTWNYKAIAYHFHTKYAYDGAYEQEQVFYDTVQQILAIVETEYRTGKLDKTGVWPWCTLASGKEWPLSKWIRVNTVSPYKRASALIRKNLEKTSGKAV